MEKEKITIGDRLSAAFIIFIASLITAIIISSIIFYTAMAANELVYFQFTLVLYFTGMFTLFAFLFPNKSINLIGWIWDKISILFKEDFR